MLPASTAAILIDRIENPFFDNIIIYHIWMNVSEFITKMDGDSCSFARLNRTYDALTKKGLQLEKNFPTTVPCPPMIFYVDSFRGVARPYACSRPHLSRGPFSTELHIVKKIEVLSSRHSEV